MVLYVFIEPFNVSFFSITGQGIGLGYVILNGLPWKLTKIILSFLGLHSSTAFQTHVDYNGCSISSKGFLPTGVDRVVIWAKFNFSVNLFHWLLKCQCTLLPSPSHLPWWMVWKGKKIGYLKMNSPLHVACFECPNFPKNVIPASPSGLW